MGFKQSFLSLKTSSALAISAAFFVSACDHQTGNLGKEERTCADGVSLHQILADAKTSADHKLVASALEDILKGDGDRASNKLNLALQEDPTNSALHTLNGIAYQLMARKGDVNVLALAEAGFQQALKFDPNNSVASLQLGRVFAQRKEYGKAQEEFANVLILDPDNVPALYELASASYLGRDLKTALPSIDRYIAARPGDEKGRQAAALIYAAAGEKERAEAQLSALAELKTDGIRSARLKKRVGDWKSVHDRGILEVAQADDEGDSSPDSEQPPAPTPGDGGEPAIPTPDLTSTAAPVPGKTAPAVPSMGSEKMVVIDAVVMRVSEGGQTSKGSNILQNFSITLAPGTHAYARGKSDSGATSINSVNVFPQPVSGTSGGSGTFTGGDNLSISHVFTQGISFGSIVYSANIANATTSKISIHDRPSVTTLVGKKSKFYSGDDLILGLTGNFGGSISRTPTGITMEVTPTTLVGDKVILEIKLYGSLINGALSDSTDKKFSKISVSSIETTVEMTLGETLLLGGITIRSDTATKSGFPILQDIPGLQYLFSNEATDSTRKSVAFMVTPKSYRKERDTIRAAFLNESDDRPSLTELEKRNKDWSSAYSNKVVILKFLGPLYREFRTGDMPSMDWWQEESLRDELVQTASFLWY